MWSRQEQESLLREYGADRSKSHCCVSVEQTGARVTAVCGADRSKSHCCVSMEQTGARVTAA